MMPSAVGRPARVCRGELYEPPQFQGLSPSDNLAKMSDMSRKWQRLLLLTLIVSQVLLGVHAATHPPVGQVKCEICSAYGDPIDSLPAGDLSPPVTVWTRECPVCSAPGPVGIHTHPACPRAPPAPI